VRGPAGGHELNRSPDEICVRDVIASLEGSLSPVSWLDDPPADTDHPHACGQREIWERVRDNCEAILREYTVADLLEREPKAVTGQYQI